MAATITVGRPAAEKGSAAMANASYWSPMVKSPIWRFTLRQLFLWTAFVALGCVALRNASGTWASSMLGLALVILAASLLLAMFREGRQRAYWIGFATAGWLYVILLAYSHGVVTTNGRWTNPFRQEDLVTTQLSHMLYTWMCEKIAPPPAPAGMASGYGGMSGMPGGSSGPGMGSAGMMSGSGYDSGMGRSDGSYGGPPGGYPTSPGGPMPGMMGSMGMGVMGPAVPTVFTPAQHDFTNVAQALWTLLLAAPAAAHWPPGCMQRDRSPRK